MLVFEYQCLWLKGLLIWSHFKIDVSEVERITADILLAGDVWILIVIIRLNADKQADGAYGDA